MSDYNYLDKGNKEGTILGKSTSSLVGFYGIQPVTQPASMACTRASVLLTGVAATAAAVQSIFISATATASAAGFSTSAEFGAFVVELINAQELLGGAEKALRDTGLIAGGTSVVTATAQPFDYVGTGGQYSEGACLGQYTSSKIAFYGVVCSSQCDAITTCSGTANATLTCTATITVGDIAANVTVCACLSLSVGGGFGNVATGNPVNTMVGALTNVITRLGELETNLTRVGLLAGTTAATSADYDYLDKGSDTGTIFGANANSKIGFWGTEPVVQAVLTTAVTTLAYTTLGAPDYTIASGIVGTAAFGAADYKQAATLVLTLINVQTRLAELEDACNALGLQAT